MPIRVHKTISYWQGVVNKYDVTAGAFHRVLLVATSRVAAQSLLSTIILGFSHLGISIEDSGPHPVKPLVSGCGTNPASHILHRMPACFRLESKGSSCMAVSSRVLGSFSARNRRRRCLLVQSRPTVTQTCLVPQFHY